MQHLLRWTHTQTDRFDHSDVAQIASKNKQRVFTLTPNGSKVGKPDRPRQSVSDFVGKASRIPAFGRFLFGRFVLFVLVFMMFRSCSLLRSSWYGVTLPVIMFGKKSERFD